MKAKEQRTLTKMRNLYTSIEDSGDLKRQKLTLYDYEVLGDMLRTLSEKKICRTFNTSVANWMKKNGCYIQMDGHKINYVITLQEVKPIVLDMEANEAEQRENA